jgi:ATP adenylyltransferase
MEADGLAGAPDGWQRLWAPHRMAYLKGENRPDISGDADSCPFCRVPTLTDEEGLIVARGSHVYAVLNLYPYNAGHMLICTSRHVAEYTNITDDERDEMALFTQCAMEALRIAAGAQGFNLGMNQGALSGAGVAPHIHQHLVPRWSGDANFMPIIGQTKVLPALLQQTRVLIVGAWPSR